MKWCEEISCLAVDTFDKARAKFINFSIMNEKVAVMEHASGLAFDLTTAMHLLQRCPAVHGMCIVSDSLQNSLICHSSAWLMHCSSDFWLCVCIWLTVNSGQCLN